MTGTAGNGTAAGLLDDINKAIVEQLQQDGRRTYGSIAEAVGLSEAAVRQRVQKMRDAGIMQIVAVTDPLQVGFRSQAMVGIRAAGAAREVAARLAAVEGAGPFEPEMFGVEGFLRGEVPAIEGDVVEGVLGEEGIL